MSRQFDGRYLFTGRHVPYDQVRQVQYYDWLISVSNALKMALPTTFYSHQVDLQTDTIATLEAFIISGLAQVPSNDLTTLSTLNKLDVFRSAWLIGGIIHPNLKPYIFRQFNNLWPIPKPQYVAVTSDEDKAVMNAMASFRQAIQDSSSSDLKVAAIDLKDQLVPAITDSVTMALLARLQYTFDKVVNVVSDKLGTYTNQMATWSKRFQLLSRDFLMYLQVMRFPKDVSKTVINVGSMSRPTVPFLLTTPSWTRTALNPTRIYLPNSGYTMYETKSNYVEPIAYSPYEAAQVYQPTYYSSPTLATPGRPLLTSRPVFIEGNQATFLGGGQEPKLAGYDPLAAIPKKKSGGCAP